MDKEIKKRVNDLISKYEVKKDLYVEYFKNEFSYESFRKMCQKDPFISKKALMILIKNNLI